MRNKLFEEAYKQIINEMNGKFAVLPIGMVNLNTGVNKNFNIYDTWFKDDSTKSWYKEGKPAMTIVKIEINDPSSIAPSIAVIFGAGGSYGNKGDMNILVHDQTGKNIARSKFLDEFTFNYGDDLEKFKNELISKIGTSVRAFVFK